MNIYLRHPVHGTKIAMIDLEADFDEQNGWVRYNNETLLDTEETVVSSVNTLEVKKRRRSIE